MDNSNSSSRSDLIPSIAVVAAAILWGVFWIPVRGVERAGVGTVWTGVLIFGCSSLALVLPIAFRWRNLVSSGWNLQWAGVLSGSAFALYTVSLNMTDVVRVILLFYMTPLWSTLLGALFLGERITLNRTLALVLAFSGLMAILGAGYRIPLPSNLGDWFALASGLIWSFASVRLFQGGATMLIEKVFVFVFYAFVFCLVLALLPLGYDNTFPTSPSLVNSWIWVLIITIMMLPMTYLTIWPTTVLSPGRVGMLLMADVVAGVTSAAILTDEQFGVRELIGTILIVSAGVVEVMRQQTVKTRPTI